MGVLLLALELKCGCEGRQERSALAKEGRFEAQNAPESQTVIVLSHEPDTIFVPSGEKATDVMTLLCAFVFSILRSSVPARQARNSSDLAKEKRFEVRNAPESQTLIVLSSDPDTILLPSGENATERM